LNSKVQLENFDPIKSTYSNMCACEWYNTWRNKDFVFMGNYYNKKNVCYL